MTAGRSSLDPIYCQALDEFAETFERAKESGQRNFNAASLATVDGSGQPSVRSVLLKGFDARGFVIYTDTGSRKAQDLAGNSRAALCFYWEPLEEQARVEGRAEPVDAAEVESDFAARPRAGQLMIWASRQSAPLADRDELAARVAQLDREYPQGAVPLPPHWGGYRISPHLIELWRGRLDRMHERTEFAAGPGGWRRRLLHP